MVTRPDRIEVYPAPDGHRWAYRAANGRILADGAQGYSRRIDALRGARRVTGADLAAAPYEATVDGQARVVWEVAR